MEELSYIIKLRRALKEDLRNMPLFQNGSAIVVESNEGKILLQLRGDKNIWGLPGGLQELGERFEETAIRELEEETGFKTKEEDLALIAVVSGESRKNEYPNGDQVYNNTILYMTNNYTGDFVLDGEELIDTGKEFLKIKETQELKFFDPDKLPDNLMDKDLLESYLKYKDMTRKTLQ